MKGQRKAKRVGLIGMVALAMVALGLVCLQGVALGIDDVPTGANVTASNTAPVIECKWELPDMDSTVSGIQYDTQDATPEWLHLHDDDMLLMPTPNYPCYGLPGTMADGATHMIQVKPNPEDNPEERRIQLWMAVDHAHGISSIDSAYWKVFHPDGEFKVQVHWDEVIQITPAECLGLGYSDTDGSMLEAAHHTGQIAADTIDDVNNGLLSLCAEQQKAIYYGEFTLSKHQPCGQYKIEAHAVSGGAEDVLTNFLDVVCVPYLEIDFETGINWGDIAPGGTDTVSGDLDFTTSNMPTVRNTGNVGMEVGVSFSEMVQVGVPGGKVIDSFDACFGKSPFTLVCHDPFGVDIEQWFGQAEPQVLCSNEDGKLDLSIHPAQELPSGDYAGTVDVLMKMEDEGNCNCSTDQRPLCLTP